MLVVRFKVKCLPDKRDATLAALQDVVLPSRKLAGVVHFDIGQDLTDPDSFVALEVFEDREALERQEALAEVGKVLALLPDAIAQEPEATIYHVSSSEPWG
jgi:quinol monooxygenase YgiN